MKGGAAQGRSREIVAGREVGRDVEGAYEAERTSGAGLRAVIDGKHEEKRGAKRETRNAIADGSNTCTHVGFVCVHSQWEQSLQVG